MLCSSQKWALRQRSGIRIITYSTHACHHPPSGIIIKHHRVLTLPPSSAPDEASDATCTVPQNPDKDGQMVKESGDWGIEREGIEQQKRRRTRSMIKEFEGTNYVRRRNEWMKVKIIIISNIFTPDT